METEIELRQVEHTDIAQLTGIINAGFSNLLGIFELWSDSSFAGFLNTFERTYCICMNKGFKAFVIGFAGLSKIHPTNHNAELTLFMIDEGGPTATIKDSAAGRKALDAILNTAFNRLNLNKLIINVLETNDILGILESRGFIAEGVRRAAIRKNNRWYDATVCSILASEYDRLNTSTT